jgi:hypothetical protein
MKNFIHVETDDIEEITKMLFLEAMKTSSNMIICNKKLYDLLIDKNEYQVFLREKEEYFGMVGNVKTYLDKNMENDVPKFITIS